MMHAKAFSPVWESSLALAIKRLRWVATVVDRVADTLSVAAPAFNLSGRGSSATWSPRSSASPRSINIMGMCMIDPPADKVMAKGAARQVAAGVAKTETAMAKQKLAARPDCRAVNSLTPQIPNDFSDNSGDNRGVTAHDWAVCESHTATLAVIVLKLDWRARWSLPPQVRGGVGGGGGRSL